MTRINKKHVVSSIAGLVAVMAIASMMMGIPPQEASASHLGDPTMWVNGINDGQTHSYIYNVPGDDLDMSVALLIKDMQEKPNVTLIATNPNGTSTTCPTAGPINGTATNLLVSECYFSPAALGIWTISITANGTINNPVGYAIAADTTYQEIPE